jgi:hypothetical protein
MLNLSFCSGLYFKNMSSLNEALSSTVANLLCILVGLILAAISCLCIFNSFKYTDCEVILKDDLIAKWRLTPYHPAFLIIHKLLMGLVMGLMFDASFRVFFPMALQVAWIVLCITKRPFKRILITARQLTNEFTVLFILIVSLIYSNMSSDSTQTIWMWL